MLEEDKKLVDSESDPKMKRVLEMIARLKESIEKSNHLSSCHYWLAVTIGGIVFFTFLFTFWCK